MTSAVVGMYFLFVLCMLNFLVDQPQAEGTYLYSLVPRQLRGTGLGHFLSKLEFIYLYRLSNSHLAIYHLSCSCLVCILINTKVHAFLDKP